MSDQDRADEIRQWFEGQGFHASAHQLGDAWSAVARRHNARIGAAAPAHGLSELQALEALYESAQHGGVPGVIVTDAADNVTLHIPVAGADAGSGVDEATVRRAPNLERVLGDFGWTFMFTNEPDGSRSYVILDAATGDFIRHGREDEWDDVLLAAITDLYPPSAEGLAG